MATDTHRIVGALESLRRALIEAGIDVPFAIEFDDAGAGYRLLQVVARDWPMQQVADVRQTGLAPKLPDRRREQGELAGVKIRWPGAFAYAGPVDE